MREPNKSLRGSRSHELCESRSRIQNESFLDECSSFFAIRWGALVNLRFIKFSPLQCSPMNVSLHVGVLRGVLYNVY